MLYYDYGLVHFSALPIINNVELLTKIDNMDLPEELSIYFICRDLHIHGYTCSKCTIVSIMRHAKTLSHRLYKQLHIYMSIVNDNPAFIKQLDKNEIFTTKIDLGRTHNGPPEEFRPMNANLLECAIYNHANKITSYLINNLKVGINRAVAMAVYANNIWVLEYCYVNKVNVWEILEMANRERLINGVSDINALRVLTKIIGIEKFDIYSIVLMYKNFVAFKYVYSNGYPKHQDELVWIMASKDLRFLEYILDIGFPIPKIYLDIANRLLPSHIIDRFKENTI